MEKITLVMLNWARPHNVRRFVNPYQMMCNHFAAIIIWDAAKDPYILANNFIPGGPGVVPVRYIRSSYDFGLPSRFAAASLARTTDVMFVDDDIELEWSTIEALRKKYDEQKHGAVGIFGRKPVIGRDSVSYSTETHHGEVDIVLTRAVITSRAIATVATGFAVDMALEIGGEPFGNGEDIVLSYEAMMITGAKNFACKLPYTNVDYDDKHAISVRYKQHEAHRARCVQWCLDNIRR